MDAGILGLVTTSGVVACRPRPLAALVLGLAIAHRPRPLAMLMLGLAIAHRPRPLLTLVLGLAVARRPRLGVLRGVALVLGVAVATNLVSCPLFACPFAAGPPPSPTMAFRTHHTWLCPGLPSRSISNSALWLSI